jgi:ABC-type lipoprotein release transport system permease subunit
VKPTDPGVYTGIGGVVLLVSLIACYAPARAAAHVDPAEVLRESNP